MGRKMVRECINCHHRKLGWSDHDGDTCEKCGSYANPIGWWNDIMKSDSPQKRKDDEV
nr:hypothetical protein [Brevibacillus laterosporus]